jgi:N-methylhydantoinase A
MLHVHEQVDIQSSPFNLAHVNKILMQLANHATSQMKQDGVISSKVHLSFSIDMRHRGQINEVEVELPAFGARAKPQLTKAGLDNLNQLFYERYEAIYGKGSSYSNARLEMVTFRVRARSATQELELKRSPKKRQTSASAAISGHRQVYWSDLSKSMRTPIYNGALLTNGLLVDGPAIIETTDTNIVVQPKQQLRVDALGNFELHFVS